MQPTYRAHLPYLLTTKRTLLLLGLLVLSRGQGNAVYGGNMSHSLNSLKGVIIGDYIGKGY